MAVVQLRPTLFDVKENEATFQLLLSGLRCSTARPVFTVIPTNTSSSRKNPPSRLKRLSNTKKKKMWKFWRLKLRLS